MNGSYNPMIGCCGPGYNPCGPGRPMPFPFLPPPGMPPNSVGYPPGSAPPGFLPPDGYTNGGTNGGSTGPSLPSLPPGTVIYPATPNSPPVAIPPGGGSPIVIDPALIPGGGMNSSMPVVVGPRGGNAATYNPGYYGTPTTYDSNPYGVSPGTWGGLGGGYYPSIGAEGDPSLMDQAKTFLSAENATLHVKNGYILAGAAALGTVAILATAKGRGRGRRR